MYKFLLVTFFAFIGLSKSASTQTDIQIQMKNYPSDTLLLGYYFADRTLVLDTLFSTNQLNFRYMPDTTMAPGMYILVSQPSGGFYQFLVNTDDQEFKVTFDHLNPTNVVFEGSDENKLFYDYLNFIGQSRSDIANIDQTLAATDSVQVSIKDQLEKDKVAINNAVEKTQNALVQKFPNSIPAILVRSNLPFAFPEFEGTEDEVEEQKYLYYKQRYFNNVDLGNPATIRTPVLDQRISYFMNNLTPSEPDSIIESLDRILGLLEPAQESYRYYLSKYLNEYGNAKYIGMDAVYVHLALEYYGKGKTPWVPKENLDEIVGNARKISPILIGKQAPDFTLYKEDGSPVHLNDLDNDYTVIVFWRPGCTHCDKAMPDVLKFYEDYKDKGVDVLAVCTSQGDKYDSCWDSIKKKNMEVLMNAGDKNNRSRIFTNYYVKSTPKTFILDKNKKIVMKKVPAENLGAVMNTFFAQKKETAEE